MRDPLLVGVDVGTSSTKALVINADGDELGHGHHPTIWHGTELDAIELVDGVTKACQDALADTHGHVAGVGVTGMGESGVLLDRAGKPMSPIIAWHDTRDADLAERLHVDVDAFAEHTGLPIRSQWSLTKHRWLLEHQPELATAVRRLNIGEWVVRALGGEEASELSLSSRTGWLDLAKRDWWPEALDWSGAPASLFAPLVHAGAALGKVTVGPPRLRGAVLTVAGHDHLAAALGVGATAPGDLFDSCGTAEALVRSVSGIPSELGRLAAAGITTGWHVLPDQLALLGGTQGGLMLRRVLSTLGDDLSIVDAEALKSGGTSGDLTPGAVWRAALEASIEPARALIQQMSEVVGPHQRMVLAGGWTASTALMELKRAAFGPFECPQVTEAGAYGAALLAGLAADVYSGVEEFP